MNSMYKYKKWYIYINGQIITLWTIACLRAQSQLPFPQTPPPGNYGSPQIGLHVLINLSESVTIWNHHILPLLLQQSHITVHGQESYFKEVRLGWCDGAKLGEKICLFPLVWASPLTRPGHSSTLLSSAWGRMPLSWMQASFEEYSRNSDNLTALELFLASHNFLRHPGWHWLYLTTPPSISWSLSPWQQTGLKEHTLHLFSTGQN